MRIAVVADTHDRVPPVLLEAIREADEIWHLGDVVSRPILRAFERLGPPVKVVRGNCDPENEWPLILNCEFAQKKCRLVHIPPAVPLPGVDLLLHGHTHVPRDEVIGKTRFLNPGCITRPNRGAPASFAWLESARAGELVWRLVPLASLG